MTVASAAASHVLVFGCPRRRRTYRALVPGAPPHHTAAPVVIIPTCPGCGEEHTVLDLYGHARQHSEAIDVVLDGAEDVPPIEVEPEPVPEPAPPIEVEPDSFPASQRISTDAILAAIPAEDAPAAEVSAALGYAAPLSLLRRIGRSPSLQRQIVVTTAGRGRHTLIRRA